MNRKYDRYYSSYSCNWLQGFTWYLVIPFLTVNSIFPPTSECQPVGLYLVQWPGKHEFPKGLSYQETCLFLLLSFSLTFSIGCGNSKRHSPKPTGLKIKSSLISLGSNNPISPWHSGFVTPTSRITSACLFKWHKEPNNGQVSSSNSMKHHCILWQKYCPFRY